MTKLIYCATPSRLKDKLNEIMDFVTDKGYGVFHPFQAFPYERFEGGPVGREKSMEFCFRAVSICDEFWMFGVSKGTLEELTYAIKYNIPVKLFLSEFDENWEKNYQEFKEQYGDLLRNLNSS